MMSESSTTNPDIPTLSLDPFQSPFEGSTVPISADEDFEKITTALFKKHTDVQTTTPTIATTIKSQELKTEMPKIDETTKITESSELTISSTTEKQNVEIKKDLKLEAMIKTIEDMLTTKASTMLSDDDITTVAPQKTSRELDLSEIPRALAQTPQRPAILSNSQETVKTTPDELSTILATLRDIVAKVESLTTARPEETSSTSTTTTITISSTPKSDEETYHVYDQRTLFKRSVDEQEDIKQKYSTVRGCTFNGGFYKIGEEITTTEDECLDCICEYSPIAHCTLKEECLLT
jgi:hypothetical protein